MPDLSVVFEPPLARIRLDRPDRRNAISAAMWNGLPAICAQIEAHAQIKVVIVEGVGGHFSAGADISEFDEVFATLDGSRAYLAAIEHGLETVAALDRPTIARLEGASFGGGLALALCCDLRFASEDAQIGVPPAKLGLLYGPVETRRLVETVGPATARDLLFSGRRVDAEEALRIGLIDRRIPKGLLAESIEDYVQELAGLSQSSIRGAKKAVAAVLANETQSLRALVEAAAMSEDFREGRAAFQAKRRPRFPSGTP